MSQLPPLHPVVAKVGRIEAELNRYLISRQTEIHGALLAFAARQHVFLLAPPGTAKTLLASEVARRVRGANFFKIDLHAYTMREEMFGPLSLEAMRTRDALERKYRGYLPDAHVAQLDEIWKCPPATLNTLLTLLNEREFRNDDKVLRAPLISAIVTSNETPPADRSLDALYDRILLRYQVAPLTDPADRKRAAEFSIEMRAFEAEARREAEQLRITHASEQVASMLDAVPTDGHDALDMARPDRWLIDQYGELLSSADTRQVFRNDMLPQEALPGGARLELLRHMVDWVEERGLELPYETFIGLRDLDALNQLVLAVRMPEPVEAAFYRILDGLGGSSVRRETELRTVISAEAVLAGRSQVAVDDLRVMIHALWDRPELLPEVRRVVEKETGNLERELEVLRATIESWRTRAAENLAVGQQLDFRTQMDQELARFERLADVYPDHPDVTDALADARAFRDDFNSGLFDFSVTPGAPRKAPGSTKSGSAPSVD